MAYKTLVEKNRELERDNGRPKEDSILYLPFIIVNTAKKTFIDCAISHDKFVGSFLFIAFLAKYDNLCSHVLSRNRSSDF